MVTPSVESLLLAAQVGQFDLSDYCIVTADTTVRETIERMRVKKQNCAFVIGKGTHLVGILTDRDVLRRVVTVPETWDAPVSAVMTQSPNTLPPDATAAQALRMMQEHHYRNVPVVDEHHVVHGNITYFAILKFLTDHFPQAVYNLPPDPTNFASDREGG